MPIILVIDCPDGVIKQKLTSIPTLLGRSSTASIKLDDNQVSGKHLHVFIGKDGKTIVKDLETTNGTFLNGSKIVEANFFLDDEITIGEITISLDGSEMTPKEKYNHTRPGEKTQHTFVNLPVDEAKAIKAAMAKVKEAAQIAAKEEDEDNAPGMRTRIINKAKKKKNQEDEVRDGQNFDLETPSGETQMLKISKPKKGKKE